METAHVEDGNAEFDVEDGFRSRLRETDPHRLAQRQKAIDYGKNTRSYQNYLEKVPKHNRPQGDDRTYPWTPDKYEVCSVRQWHGKVRHWRLRLHNYDDQPEEGEEIVEIPTAKGIKPLDVHIFQQGTKRDRHSASNDNTPSKRQSMHTGSSDVGTEEELSHPPQSLPQSAQETAGKVSGKKSTEEAEGTGEASDAKGIKPKTIYDDWDEDEDDVAL